MNKSIDLSPLQLLVLVVCPVCLGVGVTHLYYGGDVALGRGIGSLIVAFAIPFCALFIPWFAKNVNTKSGHKA